MELGPCMPWWGFRSHQFWVWIPGLLRQWTDHLEWIDADHRKQNEQQQKPKKERKPVLLVGKWSSLGGLKHLVVYLFLGHVNFTQCSEKLQNESVPLPSNKHNILYLLVYMTTKNPTGLSNFWCWHWRSKQVLQIRSTFTGFWFHPGGQVVWQFKRVEGPMKRGYDLDFLLENRQWKIDCCRVENYCLEGTQPWLFGDIGGKVSSDFCMAHLLRIKHISVIKPLIPSILKLGPPWAIQAMD